MRAAEERSHRRPGRWRRARALYRNVSKRKVAWLLLKDTVESCVEYRVTGLAAEAAFFVLLSLPPLLLGLVGALGYVDTMIGLDTIDHIRRNILSASSTVLTDRGVEQFVKPLVDDVFHGRRPDLISLGFLIALWSGSRAVNVFVDTITIMYGLDGRRGIVSTRLMSLGLYIVALVIGAAVLPLVVIGPNAISDILPGGVGIAHVLYWPFVLLASVAFLTTLYHVSVPVRATWFEDMPGALVAVLMWVLGSFVLRIYLTHTVEGPTIYGSLAAPVAVLLWIGVSAFAVLVGAAVNAAVDRVWPSLATASAREENDLLREAAAAEMVARAAARRARQTSAQIDAGVDDVVDGPADDRKGVRRSSRGDGRGDNAGTDGRGARVRGADGARSPQEHGSDLLPYGEVRAYGEVLPYGEVRAPQRPRYQPGAGPAPVGPPPGALPPAAGALPSSGAQQPAAGPGPIPPQNGRPAPRPGRDRS